MGSVFTQLYCTAGVQPTDCSTVNGQWGPLESAKWCPIMQFTGWHNGNDVRNVLCVNTQTSIEWPYSLIDFVTLFKIDFVTLFKSRLNNLCGGERALLSICYTVYSSFAFIGIISASQNTHFVFNWFSERKAIVVGAHFFTKRYLDINVRFL